MAVGDSVNCVLCSSYGCNAYTFTLDGLVAFEGNIEVSATIERDDQANAVTSFDGTIKRNEEPVKTFTIGPVSHLGNDIEETITGEPGDGVTVELETDAWQGCQMWVSGFAEDALSLSKVSVESCSALDQTVSAFSDPIRISADVLNDNQYGGNLVVEIRGTSQPILRTLDIPPGFSEHEIETTATELGMQAEQSYDLSAHPIDVYSGQTQTAPVSLQSILLPR